MTEVNIIKYGRGCWSRRIIIRDLTATSWQSYVNMAASVSVNSLLFGLWSLLIKICRVFI